VNRDRPQQSYSLGAEARCSLQKLGVIDEQIAELEKVLPLCRLDIEDAPRLEDVRELLSMERAIKSVLRCVQRLQAELSMLWPATREAMNRVQMASCAEIEAAREALAVQEAKGNHDAIEAAREVLNRAHAAGGESVIEHAQEALAALKDVLGKALTGLPKEQRRTKAASTRPIDRIYHALLLGWGRGGGGRAFNFSGIGAVARLTEVARTCYEVIGAPFENHALERPNKAFRRLQRDENGRLEAMVRQMKDARPSENLTSRP
jgi:hypothetical protein